MSRGPAKVGNISKIMSCWCKNDVCT